MKQMPEPSFSRSGFSLIEAMICLAVLAILTSIALPQILRFERRARRSEGILLTQGIYQAEQTYFAEWDRYRDNVPTMAALGTTIGFAPASAPRFYKYAMILPDGPSAGEDFFALVHTGFPGLDQDPTWDVLAIQARPGGSFGTDGVCLGYGLNPCPVGRAMLLEDDILE